MTDLTDRLLLATLDPETGGDLDAGCFASAPVEDVREAVDKIGWLFSENNKLRAEVKQLKYELSLWRPEPTPAESR